MAHLWCERCQEFRGNDVMQSTSHGSQFIFHAADHHFGGIQPTQIETKTSTEDITFKTPLQMPLVNNMKLTLFRIFQLRATIICLERPKCKWALSIRNLTESTPLPPQHLARFPNESLAGNHNTNHIYYCVRGGTGRVT